MTGNQIERDLRNIPVEFGSILSNELGDVNESQMLFYPCSDPT